MQPDDGKSVSSAAHHSTAQCLKAFGRVQQALSLAPQDLSCFIRKEALADEVGRFRVWAANIGSLQKGHSSLDYRLRESPLVHENILKFLKELFDCLQEVNLVLSGTRLPYEREDRPSVDESDSNNDSDDELSEVSSEDSAPRAITELEHRFLSIVEVIDTLYKMSRFIRAPASDARISKANSFRKIDKDTGVDLFSETPTAPEELGVDVCSQLPSSDLSYVVDSICQLRRFSPNDEATNDVELNDQFHVTVDGNYLREDTAMLQKEDSYISELKKDPRVARLARSITKRRQQFQYWVRHRNKLGLNASVDEFVEIPTSKDKGKTPVLIARTNEDARTAVAKTQDTLRVKDGQVSADETALTETTATFAGPITMTPDDTQSDISYATTARGLDGSSVELPSLPKSVTPGKDFECPYCFTICPSKYQKTKAWRAHLLRDLRPYICTYEHCPDPDQRFATRNEWNHHEEWIHRRIWQCPEHFYSRFRSKEDLEDHFQSSEHTMSSSLNWSQTCNTCETVDSDTRRVCFLCHYEFNNSKNLQKHVAFHLEKFSAFALPRTVELKDDDQSTEDASRQGSEAATGDSEASEKLESVEIDLWAMLLATAAATIKVIEEIWYRPVPRKLSPRRPRNNLEKLREIQTMNRPETLINSEHGIGLIETAIAAVQNIQNEQTRLEKGINSEDTHESERQIDKDIDTLEDFMIRANSSPSNRLRVSGSSSGMVRIAIAGGGGLARIFADELHETTHPFIILSRSDHPELTAQGYQVSVVDYDNRNELRFNLLGIDLVISTISGDPQINLIDASAHSKVHRFVPAEFEGPPSRRALNDPLDRGRKASIDRLRYWSRNPDRSMKFTVFTCGVFYERFGQGGLEALGIGASIGIQHEGDYLMNVRSGTAEVVKKTESGSPIHICLTSVFDVARFLAAAIDLRLQTWPSEFRVSGGRLSITQVLQLGAAIRGMDMFVTAVIEPQDLAAHLQHATYYQDYAKVARIQELIATEQRRYDFATPNLNPLVPHVEPVSFGNWLSTQWGTGVEDLRKPETLEQQIAPEDSKEEEEPSSTADLPMRDSGHE